MTRKYPEIRIKYAWLLADAASKPLNELWGDGTSLLSSEEYEGYVEKYKEWWQPHEEKILEGMCELLDVEFRQNVIDVYVAPWFKAFSDPMVLGIKFDTEDRLVMTLTHELTHRLLTDNTSTNKNPKKKLLTEWEKLFGKRKFITVVHIPVHATLKAIYLDVLQRSDLLAMDIERCKKSPDYAAAWEYVEANDYKEILKNLRGSYHKAKN